MKWRALLMDSTGAVFPAALRAKSAREARAKAAARGTPVLELEPADGAARTGSRRPKRVTLKERMLLFRSLGVMTGAELPLTRALKYYAKDHPDPGFSAVLHDAALRLEGGARAGEAFRRTGLFPEMELSMIEAGETSGRLSLALTRLAAALKIRIAAVSRFRKAVSVPLFTVALLGATFVTAECALVPKIEAMVKAAGGGGAAAHPFLSAAFGLSAAVRALWPFAAGALALAVPALLRGPRLRENLLGRLRRRWRGLGRLLLNMEMQTFTGALAMLHAAEVPVTAALRITAPALPPPLRRQILLTATRYENGMPLHAAMRASAPLLPEIVPHMTHVGEQSSDVARQLENLAEMFRQETDEELERFSARCAIGGLTLGAAGIAAVVLSVYLPLMMTGPALMNAH